MGFHSCLAPPCNPSKERTPRGPKIDRVWARGEALATVGRHFAFHHSPPSSSPPLSEAIARTGPSREEAKAKTAAGTEEEYHEAPRGMVVPLQERRRGKRCRARFRVALEGERRKERERATRFPPLQEKEVCVPSLFSPRDAGHTTRHAEGTVAVSPEERALFFPSVPIVEIDRGLRNVVLPWRGAAVFLFAVSTPFASARLSTLLPQSKNPQSTVLEGRRKTRKEKRRRTTWGLEPPHLPHAKQRHR